MKKLLGVLGVAVCLSIGAVDRASAVEAGPFMVTFPGFCDCITIYHDAFGTGPGGPRYLYGTWDWTCAGAPPYAPMTGVKTDFVLGGSPHVPAESGFTATFDFGGGSVDLFGTVAGGSGDAFLFVDNVSYVVAAGSCPGAPANGNPPLLSRAQ
jgi:hypothetical protein